MKHFRILLLCFLLTACSKQPIQPEISFVGISTGSLATELDELNFLEVLPVDEHEILGVVSFDKVTAGTLVQATWFSPDDRNMPLGRNTITVASGAKIVRFSIAAKEDWTPAPYMLDVRARTEVKEGSDPLTASGQVHFFFGMEEEQITAYKEDYGAWQEAQAEKRQKYAIQKQHEDAAVERAKELLEAEEIAIGFRYDITSNGTNDLVIIDPKQEDMMPGSTESGALFSAEIDQLAVLDMSGSTILLLSKDSEETKSILHAGAVLSTLQTSEMVTVHVFSNSFRFDWPWKGETCMATIMKEDEVFVQTKRECTVVEVEEKVDLSP